MPNTRLGLWSVGLITAFFLSFLALQLLIASGQRGGDTFFSNLLLAIPGVITGIFGVSAFAVGTIAIIKSKERSLLTFISVTVGLLVLAFILAEVIGPH